MSELTAYSSYSGPNVALIAAAVIPALALLLYVYRKDRLEKEPASLLFSLVFKGIIATSLAFYAERIAVHLLASVMDSETILFQLLFNIVIVGGAEEGAKYLFLYRRTWRSPHFNCQFDAVVYAVFVSLGFALWENLDYVAFYGMGTAVARALTAVPGHACFGVFMGVWYGLAKAHEKAGHADRCRTCKCLALLCPLLLHGLYDFIATVDESEPAFWFLGFIGVMFVAAYVTIRRTARQDRYF